jgi:hypothetical protein
VIESPLSEEEKQRYTPTPVKNHGPAKLISKKYGGKRKSMKEHIARHAGQETVRALESLLPDE